jgi:hypothetical protein
MDCKFNYKVLSNNLRDDFVRIVSIEDIMVMSLLFSSSPCIIQENVG